MSETKYEDYFKDDLVAIDQMLDRLLPAETQKPAELHEAMRYSVFPGGKRFRAILTIAACEALGGSRQEALIPAASLELIHSYSLVHDDLPALDDDEMRRGKLTCHKQYGEAMAILVGDGLLTFALEILAKIQPAERAVALLAEISTSAGTYGMIGGQVVDLKASGEELNLPQLEFINIHKTGKLIKASTVSGAIAAGASEEDLQHMLRYGELLGLAFQSVDDLLDGDGYMKLMEAKEVRDKTRDLIAKAKKEIKAYGSRGEKITKVSRLSSAKDATKFMTQSKWIHKINSPADLKKVPLDHLPEVASEFREALIESVSKTGGHLGASLGALELNIALHYVLDSPNDKICWDVGHQAYVHKMLTGRKDRMDTIRQPHGLSGFPSPFENEHDHFIVGHAGTAISQAIGLAAARDFKRDNNEVVAVVGDGALTSGLSYEALNNAGHMKRKMLIILNDNKMSISKNVGGLSKYLNQVITNPLYNRVRNEVEKQLDKFPRLRKLANTSLEGMKHLFVPGILFEELGYRYFGPVDGHNIIELVKTLKKVLSLNEASFLHVITEKGKGYSFAEVHHERLHGVTPFDVKTGEKIAPPKKTGSAGVPYTKVFVNALNRLAKEDKGVVAITAAMPSGTGLASFEKEFPERFFDVGIAEQHAVTFSGALAKGGMKPVCAIYSTFLQRAQDNIIHDISLQRQRSVLALDRAGLVGADGATHNGVFDISYMGHIPKSVIAAPLDEFEMEQMLRLGVNYPHVFALRYPRGNVPAIYESLEKQPFQIGEGQIVREGSDATLLALGTMVETSLKAAELLKNEGVDVRVVNMRFAKPLDQNLIMDSIQKTRMLFTLEEHVLTGGFGSKVLECLEQNQLTGTPVHRFALPDEFIEHGSRDELLDQFGLSVGKVASRILSVLRENESVSMPQS